MSRVYFDSNVVLYILDVRPEAAAKQLISEKLLAAHVNAREAVISTQVLQETYDNAVRKLKLPSPLVAEYVRDLSQLEVIATDGTLVLEAIAVSQRYQFRIFDALMIAAAKKAGCATLYTEDLSHGQVIDGVRIVNPFKEQEAKP